MARPPTQFTMPMRILHWLMAAMVLTMLFIGISMVASLANYHTLVAIHRPLGIAILLIACIRLIVRIVSPLPPFPATVPPPERLVATASEYLMYSLLFVLPLVGWGMLSAARYPVAMFGGFSLPYILPHNLALYFWLRRTHTVLAYLFFFVFLGHFSAVLFHTLVIRDGLLFRMVPWSWRQKQTEPVSHAEQHAAS